ncbi:MAG: hypothetical protein KAY37_09115 [Phycisphaerae bacterium]|nr:hypothetical protein [Phycisphaerae bacterium]
MRWSVRIGLGLAVCLICVPAAFTAEKQITAEYSFDRPTISQVNIGRVQYDRIHMPGVPNCGNAGQPALPADGARILLPYGTAVASIEVVPSEMVSLGSGFMIEPVSPGVPLSADPGSAELPTPDPAIYGADRPFPGALHEEIGTQGFRGHQILVLKLHPVHYVPTSGELYYYPRLTVMVNTIATGRSPALYRGLAGDNAEVRAKVDNPGIAATYAVSGFRGVRSFELLILTTPTLADSFVPLKDFHDTHGIPTEIHTTTDVGSTNPDDVRDYISDRYYNDGITYVLIGGDDDVIPAKDLYVVSDPGPWPYIEYNMPGDLYFGCLDGTWNYDGDSYWGEPTDGPGGGDVDLIAEVYLGRASVGNTTEAARFVNKTLWYLTGQHAYPEKALLVGEYLGFGGPSEYAGDTLDELADGSSAHGYTTVGIPSSLYAIDKLYERDWPGHSWPQSELVTRINSGLHLLNHLGHGAPDYAMKLYNSDITTLLTNNDLCFVYSQTCSAGHFDGTDCWAETANIKTDYGAFAVVMNARAGWGDWNTTDGASQRFNREFWDAVFNPAENMPELGRANQDSKEDNLYRINQDYMRWITYELTVFGDPTLAFGEVTGLRVSPSTALNAEGDAGGPFTPDSIIYTLENASEIGINYNVTHSASWVTVTNESGYLPPEGTAQVTVSINSEANSFGNGYYTDTVNFINTTTHEGDTSRSVNLKIGVPSVQYSFPLDTNPGWTMNGEWAFGQPTGQGGTNYGGPDPTSGATGSNVIGVNLNGDYSLTPGGPYHVTLGPLDLTAVAEVDLRFQRWLNTDYQPYVYATLEMSTDGSTWQTLWQNGSQEVADSSWNAMAYPAPAAEDQDTVYFRWGYQVNDGAWAYSGWNIDDIEIWGLAVAPPPVCRGDSNCDEWINWRDIGFFVAALNDDVAAWEAMFLPGTPTCSFDNNDVNDDGTVNWRDIDPLVTLMNTTCP